MRTYTLYMLLFLGAATCLHADLPKDTTQIINKSDLNLDLSYSVPANSSVLIKFTKLGSPQAQEMLYAAIEHDSPQEIKQAVQAEADLNKVEHGKSPLKRAVLSHCYHAMEALLECGVKADEAIMQHAVKTHDIKSVVLFVRKGGAKLPLKDVSSLIFNSKNADIVWRSTKKLMHSGYKITSCKVLELSAYLSEVAKAKLADKR